MIRIFLILIFLLDLNYCRGEEKLKIILGFFPGVQFAPLYIGIEKGYFREKNLLLEFKYSTESNIISLVSFGKEDVTISDGENIILGRAAGLKVISVLPYYRSYPLCILSFKNAGINTLADLEGKKLGIPELYGSSFISFKAIEDSGLIRPGKIQLKTIGFTQTAALEKKLVDAAVCYINHEPVVLQSKGKNISIIRIDSVKPLIGPSIVVSEKFLKDQAPKLFGFISAFKKSLEFIFSNPDETLKLLKKYIPEISHNLDLQRKILTETIKLWKEDSKTVPQEIMWKNSANLLYSSGLIKKQVNIADCFTNMFQNP